MNAMMVLTAGSAGQVCRAREAGADEIAVALQGYACSGLEPFRLEQLKSLGPVSVLMNRLLFPEELESAETVLEALCSLEIPHIYFADPGLALLAEQKGLKGRLIYRPETLVTSGQDARWWQEQGIAAVSVSPLITREELLSFCQGTEVTVYGRLLMSASRRCLLSAYGETAGLSQELRGSRTLSIREAKRSEHMPIFEDESGTLIYTDYVLESFRFLQDLESHGTARLYLDSALSSFESACSAMQAYRRILAGGDAEAERTAWLKANPAIPVSTGYYEEKTIR